MGQCLMLLNEIRRCLYLKYATVAGKHVNCRENIKSHENFVMYTGHQVQKEQWNNRGCNHLEIYFECWRDPEN